MCFGRCGMRLSDVTAIASEYGLGWLVNRGLYVGKLGLLRRIPSAERLFEKKCGVKRIDVFDTCLDFEEVRKFLQSLPVSAKTHLISQANKAVEGKILAFSSIELNFGSPVDWFVNPLTGQRVSSTYKWFKISDFDDQQGDIKIYWEVSRFNQALLFARAALLTGDERYHASYSDQLASWLRENPYSFGPNYKCGQENALRMMNVLIANSTFSFLGMSTEQDEENVRELVSRSYRRIQANFFYADKCIRNNHTLSELCGLVIGSWCCNESDKCAKFFEKLDKEFCRQFLSDGGYIQWSFNYQRFALQLAELVMCLQKRLQLCLSDEAVSRFSESVSLLYQVQLTDGTLPNYGSNDGALIFPLSSCTFRDYRPLVACLARQTGHCSPYVPGVWDEESLWFGARDPRVGTALIQSPSAAFDQAGLYSLRSSKVSAMMVIQDFKNHRPAHMDQLHLDVSCGDKNILSDGGTYSYASELGDELIRTRSHNTAVVGLDQMTKHGAFLLYNWTRRRRAVIIDGQFTGSYTSRDGYTHERKVAIENDGSLCIEDSVHMSSLRPETYVELVFHTIFPVQREGSTIHISNESNGHAFLIFDNRGLCDLLLEGCSQSPRYLETVPATKIVARYESRVMELGIVTRFRFE